MSRQIDAHQHFWRVSRGDYGWLTPELAAIYRDFGPAALTPLLDRHGIGATILVQAAPTAEETRFLLEIAAAEPIVAGVVGWVALDRPGAAVEVAGLADNDLLVGLRPMLHDLPQDDWILRPETAPGLEEVQRQGLVFDALIRPPHLPHLLRLAERHPALSIVIDHAAKPELRRGWSDDWAAGMRALARHAQVCCKFSGLLTEAGPGTGAALLAPYLDLLLDAFGPERLVWGSDWPVLTLAADYDRWRDVTMELLEPLPPEARHAILGGNAERIYLSRRGRRTDHAEAY
ncbi:amidohydrolase family protein [Roseomonas marmotae]|uniref:Amidohydrolase family protein n=1 Tax=Roseomonas marmotae TaxID=2768161 RepID=A0ABS3KFF6_9PROT|nr:amidohydrolase family protein [Roseomonas marmotae]MBO1076210.1 amidohydrolase family protein [Roseomonas marmotae]QTI82000.1 amidohydrolase family protein [Roseomonas marmotae]